MKILRNVLLSIFTIFYISTGYAENTDKTNTYIVVLKPNTLPSEVATQVAQQTYGRVGYVYERAIQGFSISIPERALSGVLKNPNVWYVEQDLPITAFVQTTPTGVHRIFANDAVLSINNTDDLRVDADVAVLDTGIDIDHEDLNVVGGANCLNYSGRSPLYKTYFCDSSVSYDDDHYHGTHVAGTIGALDNNVGVVGIAPGVRLWAVKVLDSSGSGSLAGIIAGIDWVVKQGNIKVINMSLGGSGQSSAMNSAIETAFKSGVFVVVAAGNSNADSAGYTPANAPYAFTVSALADFDGEEGGYGFATCRTDEDDTLANFSNWGDPVNIVAPGVCIVSTFPIERGSYGTISGTSMASPHVAGAAALLASKGLLPDQIQTTLVENGNDNWEDTSTDDIKEPLLDISSAYFEPNLLSVTISNENVPPTAQFEVNCVNLTCTFDASTSTDSDGTIVSYDWNFGDGSIGTDKFQTNVYGAYAQYTVTLTVTDNEGAKDVYEKSVMVSEAPEVVTQSFNKGKTWTAVVSYSSGDYISGEWVGFGICTLSEECILENISKKQGSVTFIDDLSNESITVYKP
ncbi:S8 family serine peptidase [Vibrio ziniensis]|uniref:S8 family serine peptidase n=1 Tax=Vibrio ziniensis TaxID=2711221 RepID=A0A6G7CN75_9VIBR|nr:S8 family serine peptidase [Vibrio ziniensis]QIH43520.1 S8 family serine peptidase [Vibrio ziniensis]